jgi:hypothetical protein
MVLDGKTKQAAIFIGGDQFKGPGIAGFLGIGPAPLCVPHRAPSVIASGLDGPRGILDVSVTAAQIQRPGHPVAAPEQKDDGRAQRPGYLIPFRS